MKGGNVKNVNSKAELEKAVAEGDSVIVHFWAGWCEAVSYTHLTLPTNREV